MSVASRAILLNFFVEEWTQNHLQYLSGLSRALFPTTFLEIAVYPGLCGPTRDVYLLTDTAIYMTCEFIASTRSK